MNVNLVPLDQIEGFIGACLVDCESGTMLGQLGGECLDLETAAAANTQVVNVERRTMAALELSEDIEDFLISLKSQYHIIRPLAEAETFFFYMVLDRDKANLAMARYSLREFENTFHL